MTLSLDPEIAVALLARAEAMAGITMPDRSLESYDNLMRYRDRGRGVARQILVYPILDDRTLDPDPELTPFAT